LLDGVTGAIASFAHVIGLLLVVYALFSVVQALERGDAFTGLLKAGLRGIIGIVLMKL
jgi:hypothetical protein